MESLIAGAQNGLSANGTINLLVCLSAMVGKELNVPGGRYLYISKDDSSGGASRGTIFMAMSTTGDFTYVIANRCIQSIPTPPSTYIVCIYGSDLKKILKNAEYQLDFISCDDKRWKPETKMFVLLFTDMSSTKYQNVASRLIRMMWSRVVYNCAVLIMTSSGSIGKVFVADPFAEENVCGRRLRSCRPVMSCPKHNSVQYNFTGQRRVFPDCEISVSTRVTPPFSFQDDDEWKGADVELVKTMADHLTLRILWQERTSGEENDDTEVYHYYDELANNTIDLAIGGCVVSQRNYHLVEYLRSHQTQYLAFYVANSRPVSKWKVLYIMFPPEVWWCVVLSFCGAVGVMYLYKTWFGGTGSPSLSVLGILLQWPVKLPVHTSLRLFFISLIVPYFGLSAIYTTYLHSLTIRSPARRGVNSLQDIYKKRMVVLTTNSNIFRLKEVKVKELQALFAHSLKHVISIQNASSMVQEQRDFTILEREMIMEYLIALNGYSLRKLPYYMHLMNLALVVPKGSLFKESLDELILMSVEFGLFQKWKRDVMRDARIKRSRYTDDGSGSPRALNFSDLQPAFQILFFGLGLSVLIFGLEVIRGRSHSNNHRLDEDMPANERFSFRH